MRIIPIYSAFDGHLFVVRDDLKPKQVGVDAEGRFRINTAPLAFDQEIDLIKISNHTNLVAEGLASWEDKLVSSPSVFRLWVDILGKAISIGLDNIPSMTFGRSPSNVYESVNGTVEIEFKTTQFFKEMGIGGESKFKVFFNLVGVIGNDSNVINISCHTKFEFAEKTPATVKAAIEASFSPMGYELIAARTQPK